jgi:hypothetical protein
VSRRGCGEGEEDDDEEEWQRHAYAWWSCRVAVPPVLRRHLKAAERGKGNKSLVGTRF